MTLSKRLFNKRYFTFIFLIVLTFIIYFFVYYSRKTYFINPIKPYYPVFCNALDYKNETSTLLQHIKNITKCKDKYTYAKVKQRGEFWVLSNYFMSERRFKCEESVTYTTHADYTFLNNLPPILETWQGPVSIAVHAPGSDFQTTFESIVYLRSCFPLIREFVNFHIYFNKSHVPEKIPLSKVASSRTYNCSVPPPFHNVNRRSMYIEQEKLIYPINVGRNIARSMAETHFILASDIELYPTANFSSNFFQTIASCNEVIKQYTPAVFAFSVFEVQNNRGIPNNKLELLKMLKEGSAVPFHKYICPDCHSVPGFKKWKKSHNYEGVTILQVAKRIGKVYHWEPVYVGTNDDPWYDERLSWEGQYDKIVQAYTMCLMDYSFFILDGTFLVHKPGIKKHNSKQAIWRTKYINVTNNLLYQVILPELSRLYGKPENCKL